MKTTFSLRSVRRVAFALIFAGAAVTPLIAADGTEAGGYEVIANAYGFAVDIPGAGGASKNIREISIDELNIDIREMTSGLDVEYRLYGPGQAHWGSAKFTCALTSASKELQAWFQEAAKGKNIRKNITVTLFKSDKTPGRSYTLNECFPTQWASVNFDDKFRGPTETITVQIGSIEFDAAPHKPRTHDGGNGGDGGSASGGAKEFHGLGGNGGSASGGAFDAPAVAFNVDLQGESSHERENGWEHVSGGALMIEVTTAVGAGKFHTHSPGHKSIEEITLRGAMTDNRAALCQWINDTVSGKPWKRMLTITELLSVDGAVKPGKAYHYMDCFPVRYVFPRMSVVNTVGNFEEKVICEGIRDILDLPPQAQTSLQIPRAPLASKNTQLMTIHDLEMDTALLSTGDIRNPYATLILPATAAGELLEWGKMVATGVQDFRDVTLDYFTGNGNVLAEWLLQGCYPTGHQQFVSNGSVMEEVAIKPIRVELK